MQNLCHFLRYISPPLINSYLPLCEWKKKKASQFLRFIKVLMRNRYKRAKSVLICLQSWNKACVLIVPYVSHLVALSIDPAKCKANHINHLEGILKLHIEIAQVQFLGICNRQQLFQIRRQVPFMQCLFVHQRLSARRETAALLSS